MKKLFTLLTMLILGISGMWATSTPVVVTFGNNAGIDGLTTDAFNFATQNNISQTLSDGTTLAFTPTNLVFWAGSDGNIEGSWTNSVAIADINTKLATSTSFTAALFSANSSLKYLATGNQGSTSSLTLTFNNKQEGDPITLYASLARRGGTLDNFSATGLNGMQIKYARKGGNGFSDTPEYSQRSGSSNDSPVTIVKITGKLSSSKTLTMSSTSAKNGWQMIAYKFDYPHVTGSVTNNDKNLGTIHVTRSHSLSGEVKTLDIVTQTGTNPHSVYQNATNQTFTICAGQDIKVSYNQVGWMHAYMYIDYNNDGQFSPYTIQESGIPTEGSELVSYTCFNEKNSKGESANESNSGTSLPVFTIPSDLPQGTYRARYKLDWDFLDPYGSDASNRENNFTIDNRGVIIDFIIQVVPKYTVTSDTKLSEISNYSSYKTIYVNEDVTLTVDVDDFDLAYISGAGNIILDANAPLSDITASGSLTVNSGKTLVVTAENFDLTKITGSGTVVLDADVTLSGGKSTVATGKLIINEGKTLNIGAGDTETNSIASFTSIDLAGTIMHRNSKDTWKNITVPTGKTGKIFAYDMGDDADGFRLAGTTTLNGNLTVCSKWNFQMKVDELAGAGTWLICGTTGSNFDDTGTSSDQAATINVANASTYTGNVTVNNTNATVNVSGNLAASSWTKTNGTLKYKGNNLNGTTLDRVILAGSARLNLSNTVTIKNLAGNDLSASTNNYAIATSNAACLVLEGTCDFKHKADNTETSFYNISIGNTNGSITIKSGANVSCGKIWWSDDKSNAPITVESGATLGSSGAINASTITNNGTVTATGRLYANTITNNGTITALKLQGNAVLGDGTTTLSDSEGITKAITVNGDATLNLTATTSTLSQAITVDDSKTLTIDGKNNTVVLTGAVTNNGTINFKNATLTANLNDRTLANYTFTGCTATLQFVETGDEYKVGVFTITNVPSGVTVKVKKYGATDYETVTPTDGTVTISHSVEVSGSAAWLDYTFNESTIDSNTHDPADRVINNAGNAGISGNSLETDTGYNTDNSYNEDGTLKVMSTPYRSITWPTNYTVAVAGNVPDVENGCLVAFGSSTAGSKNYLAIIRGATQNEIKLVKGYGSSTFEVISTMAAANATALSHLVVFTKQGDNFDVYLDGVNVAHTTYSEALGGGFQIGSIHGGVPTGIVRVSAMSDATAKAKVFAKAIRVYDYVISEEQMEQLKEEFPYTSYGGKYTRTISENCNLSATNAWLNKGTQGHVNIPVNAVVDKVTYYPDVEITTDAASTLTVNANMDTENIKFDGTGKLTIASDGEHNIHIYGSLTANGPISVKYGETDLSAVPVTIGESGSVEFDFSASDFSSVNVPTDYPVTGNTADYGSKVTGVYPSDIYHTFTITHKSTTNSYYLTVGPSVALKRQQAIDLVTPYYNGNYVGVGAGKYTISLGETSYAEMADFGTAVMSWASLEDCIDPTIIINQPTSGYYQIKSKYNENTGYYLSCENNNDGKAIQTTTNDAKNIFYIEVGNSSIKSYSTGFYFGNETYSNYTSATNDPIKWTFSEGQSIGTYKLTSTYSGSKILYGWSTDDKSYVDRNGTADTDGHTDWILIPIAKEDLPVIEAPGSTETNPVIQGKIESTDDVTDKITASATFVDLSDATIDASIDEIKAEVEKINPNAIIIAPEGTSVESTTTNVLLTTDTENTYTCNNLQFTDNVIAQFTSETNFTDTKVTYTRNSSASVWGTICLPYATSTEGDVSYYRLAESSTSNLRFEKISESTTTPNEPYLIKKAANAGLSIGADDQDFTIGVAEPQEVSSENDYKLQGVLVNTSVIDGDNYTTAKSGYVATTDANAYYFDAASTKFCKLNGRFNLKAFRAYLTTNSGEARPNIGFDLFDDDQPTGVNIIESEDGNTVDVIFDLNGRHLQNAKKGINIINGKKVIK